MTKDKYIQIVNKIHTMRMDLHDKKASDYANEKDVLSNFKRLSKFAKDLDINVQTPHGYALFMILMKIDRINNLFGRESKNETIYDSFIDAHNYLDLCMSCYSEELNEQITDISS